MKFIIPIALALLATTSYAQVFEFTTVHISDYSGVYFDHQDYNNDGNIDLVDKDRNIVNISDITKLRKELKEGTKAEPKKQDIKSR